MGCAFSIGARCGCGDRRLILWPQREGRLELSVSVAVSVVDAGTVFAGDRLVIGARMGRMHCV